ncbi:MAG: dicarboxylate/amino acid:cation symporter [Planctomycetes bacterium]|nr:dicarboxylate/amino acid:cation symporter [Planctomycetota bacterium]
MMARIPIHVKIIASLLLGVAAGVALNLWWTDATWASLGVTDKAAFLAGGEGNSQAGWAAAMVKFAVDGTRFFGKLFIRCLQFIAVPIVLFSLIAGAASLGDVRKLGRIGGKTLFWFLVTTAIAIIIGIALTSAVRPGERIGEASKTKLTAQYAAEASKKTDEGKIKAKSMTAWDQLLDTVPANPFAALANAQMIQVVLFALVIGGALTVIPKEKAKVVIDACDALTEAITMLVQGVMKFAPYAVFTLICPIIATTGLDVLAALAIYALVVVVGLSIVNFGLYPLLLWFFTPRHNRVTFSRFFRAMAPAQLLAFSSSSSNATLPVNMACARRIGVPEDIVSFVLPLGATINMNGTALYQAVVAVFLAQLYGIPLTLGDQVMLILTATLVAVGTAGVPGASIVLMVIVLQSVHVPTEGIAVILGMDRILDMCRTVVNTGGDAMTATIVAASEGVLEHRRADDPGEFA